MKKSEKIILTMAGLSLLYGGFDFLFVSSKPPVVDTGKDLKEVNDTIAAVSADLSKDRGFKNVNYTISRARSEWEKDPFFKEDMPIADEPVEIADTPETAEYDYSANFTYFGYMAMGEMKMAIINGLEYKIGDEVEPGGFIVNGIFPTRVVIGIKGTQDEVVVPLIEEGSGQPE